MMNPNMTREEAIEYCKTHKCEECYSNRSVVNLFRKYVVVNIAHLPCYFNLVSLEELEKMNQDDKMNTDKTVLNHIHDIHPTRLRILHPTFKEIQTYENSEKHMD